MKDKPRAFRYFVDRVIRSGVMWLIGRITFREADVAVDLQRQEIKSILLVRALFRLGDSILATPVILLLRENFPQARIDFVGPRVTKGLFHNLPVDNYLEIHRSLPQVLWSYFALLIRLRRRRYDLAIDVSGSSAAMGSFIVGFSKARWRAGLRGKWDRWFNVRLARPAQQNKYGNLPELMGSLGLRSEPVFPTVILSRAEIANGKAQIDAFLAARPGAIVGIFVGGRRTRGKRWDKEKFLALAVQLRGVGLRPIVFVGPEEQELLAYFRAVLSHRAPVVFEPSVVGFAALVANCDLFVACDSGPVHLACALNVRTVAIFLKDNLDRWGPPPELARVVYGAGTISAAAVADACRKELAGILPVASSQRPSQRPALAPASFLMGRDVNEGRKTLNFSLWYSHDQARKKNVAKEIAKDVGRRDMPPWYYVPLHPAAKLSAEEREMIVKWTK